MLDINYCIKNDVNHRKTYQGLYMFKWVNKKINIALHWIWNYLKNLELQKITNSENKYYKIPLLWKSNYEVVLLAVKNGCRYQDIPSQWLTNKNIMITLVNHDPSNLKYVKQFQCDEEIVCLLLMKDPSVLQHASQKIQDNASIVRLAVKNNSYILRYASDELKNNKKFLIEMIIKGGGFAFYHASNNLKNNWEFLLEALTKVKSHESFFFQISTKLLMNPDFFLLSALINDAPYCWVSQNWTYRLDELPPGIPDKLMKKTKEITMTTNGRIDCRLYEALLSIAHEKENELKNKGIYHPMRVYLAGATYGLLNSRRLIDEDKASPVVPHIPFDIAMLITEFSAIYSERSRAVVGINRYALNNSTDALRKTKKAGGFRFPH